MATGAGKTGRILKCVFSVAYGRPLPRTATANIATGLFRHERKSLRPAEAAATGAVFFQNARKPKPEVAFCYISSLFQSARKPLTRLLEAQARRRLFQSTRPLSPLSICRPLRLRRAFPTCTEGGSQERQTGLFRHARKGRASASAVSAPSFYRLRLCLLYALRLLGGCSASRVPRSFCRPLALLWAVAELPYFGPPFRASKNSPRSLPAKAAPATRRKSNSGNPRTPSPCRMAHGSPHAPCPHGLRSLSVKEKEALFPSSCSRCINFSTFW